MNGDAKLEHPLVGHVGRHHRCGRRGRDDERVRPEVGRVRDPSRHGSERRLGRWLHGVLRRQLQLREVHEPDSPADVVHDRPVHERPVQVSPVQLRPVHERPHQLSEHQQSPANQRPIHEPRFQVWAASDSGAHTKPSHGMPTMSCSPISSMPSSATCDVPRAASRLPVPVPQVCPWVVMAGTA